MYINICQSSDIQSPQKSVLEKRAFQQTFTGEVIPFEPYLRRRKINRMLAGLACFLFLSVILASNVHP